MGKEKRHFKRLPIRGFMSCSTDFLLKEQQVVGVDVLSLSAGGMFIALDESKNHEMVHGDDLDEITIHLAELNGLALKGKVAHLMSLGEIGGCGIEFEDMGEDTVTKLDRYVSRKLEEFGLAAF